MNVFRFVHMDNEDEARAAIQGLNQRVVKGRPMKVEMSESKGPKKPTTKIFIGNVADGTTNDVSIYKNNRGAKY